MEIKEGMDELESVKHSVVVEAPSKVLAHMCFGE